MLGMYAFLSQIPIETLIEKQKEVLTRFGHHSIKSQGIPLIYYISDGYATKIGKTNNDVFKRMEALQTGNPRRLILMAVKFIYDSELSDEENLLHQEFSNKKIRGEWFYFSESDFYHTPWCTSIVFADYFCKEFSGKEFYATENSLERNINDRIENNYCRKKPYYQNKIYK